VRFSSAPWLSMVEGLQACLLHGGDGGFEAVALGEGEGGSDDFGCGEVCHDAVECEVGLAF
jgi:hypothetical protein